MADKATGSLSASIMTDYAKKTLAGGLSYEPADTGDKWIYLETIADGSSVPLIAAGRQYAERYIRADEGTETVTATGDIVRWMGIKNTGKDGAGSTTSAGIVISLAGSGAAAFDEVEGIFIDAGETCFIKTAATTLNTIGVISVAVTNGVPVTGGSPGDVLVIVAAILDDA